MIHCYVGYCSAIVISPNMEGIFKMAPPYTQTADFQMNRFPASELHEKFNKNFMLVHINMFIAVLKTRTTLLSFHRNILYNIFNPLYS